MTVVCDPVTAVRLHRPGASSYLLVALIGLIAVTPIWIPAFPPMCDAPQQAAQVAIYSHLDHPGFAYSQLFVRHIWTPNLAGYALLFLLKPAIGVLAAWKLVTSAALFGFLIATSLLIAEFGGDPRLALLGVLGLYGYPFQWGLIAFLVTTPLGIGFLIFAIRYFRYPTPRRGLGLALFFLLLFFCHAMVAAYAAGMAAVYALSEMHSLRQLFLRWLPMLAVVPAAGLWWLRSISHNPFAHQPVEWHLNWDRISELFTNITGWPSIGWQDDALAAFFVIGATLPLIVLLGLRREVRFYFLLAASLAVAFFAPGGLVGTSSIYQRHVLFVLPFLALTFAPWVETTKHRGRMAAAWLFVVAIGWTSCVAWRMTIFERESRGFSSLLPQMDPGQRMLFINFNHNSRAFSGAVLLHHAVWYSALKGGIADPSFACGHVDLVLYRPEAMPPVRFADFEFHPQSFDWQRHRAWQYRYIVVHASSDMSQRLFRNAQFPVALRAHDGDWWLYENPVTGAP